MCVYVVTINVTVWCHVRDGVTYIVVVVIVTTVNATVARMSI